MDVLEKKNTKLLAEGKSKDKSALIAMAKNIKVFYIHLEIKMQEKSSTAVVMINWSIRLLIFGFLFYALVFVQCNPQSSRACPLPFDPQVKIKEASEIFKSVYSKYEPVVQKYVKHTEKIVSEEIKPHFDQALTSFTSVTKQLNDNPTFSRFANHEWVAMTIDTSSLVLLKVGKGVFDFYYLAESSSRPLRDTIAHQYSIIKHNVIQKWHAGAVFTVERIYPQIALVSNTGAKFVRTKVKLVRAYFNHYYKKAGKLVTRHPAYVATMKQPFVIQISEAYQVYAKSQVDLVSQYFLAVWDGLFSGIDSFWMFLEGKIAVKDVSKWMAVRGAQIWKLLGLKV